MSATRRQPRTSRVGPSDVETTHIRVRELGTTADELTLTVSTGERLRFNRFWLRHNCPSIGQRASLFRSFSMADLADDLSLLDATTTASGDHVEISFSDGTRDTFAVDWLLDRHQTVTDVTTAVVTWRAGDELPRLPFADLGLRSAGQLGLLEAVARTGAALVTGVPDAAATETLAALLGPIRETDFGRIFDIVSEPDAFTPSQTADALDPHTDDPYRYNPAGVSILHCVVPSAAGGGSSIVDGFAVAEDIRRAAPDDFDLLSTVPVDFAHRRDETVDQGDEVHLLASAPIIATDRRGDPCGIRFHERAMGVLSVDADLAERLYPAMRRFARAVRGDDYRWHRALRAGEALVYDNQRVLHGRDGFDAASRRHLRLCTVDRDQVHSRLRRLRAHFGTGTEHQPLPSGNLS
ncbi:MAG: TauD/TfdA family dioxygenase [Actinomycetota bacterium]